MRSLEDPLRLWIASLEDHPPHLQMPSADKSDGQSVVWLEHPDGRVSIEELPDGRPRMKVHPKTGIPVSLGERVTVYPVDLIARILEVKSPAHVGDEIAREEDPNYVARNLRYGLLSYLPEEAFKDSRILDFGSGSGASTLILDRMFPDAEIVATELEPDLIDIAKRRAALYGRSNPLFLQSPDPHTLPDDLGDFDFINLSAVYETCCPTSDHGCSRSCGHC